MRARPRRRAAQRLTVALCRRLVAAAAAARRRAYAPYSGFAVGAAVLDEHGRVHAGANVENASYGLTICAERSAIFRAVAEGARRIRAVAIVAGPAGRSPARAERPVGPCGACRQVIHEFGPDAEVVLLSRRGIESVPIGALLPEAFGPSDL